MAKRHVHIRVYGEVQGVSFRAAAKKIAEMLHITGFVRNEPDGSVYMEAEGDGLMIDELVAWCHTGTAHAKVVKVEVGEGMAHDFTAFCIEY